VSDESTNPASGARPGPAGSPAAAEAPPPIEIRGLVKRYGDLTAVAGVDLTVRAGDVYGYLGPNGAGKTTSLRMMLGLISPTAGTIRLFGQDPTQSVHALAGVAGFVEAPTFYPYLTARRNLQMMAAFDGGDARDRVTDVLETVELTGRADDRVGGYSHGMRQRLGIAAALLRNPRLLLLDEPATGLDPGGMRDMRVLIRRLADQGMTVLLSSHLMNEVEELCNRVAIVRSGRIVYEGEISALKRGASTLYRLETTDDQRALAVCRAQAGIADVQLEAGHITFSADENAVAALSQALVESGALIRAMAPQTVTLEDLFFSFTEGDSVQEAAGTADAAAATTPVVH
jgi:ABC-2 type transport system ATP-binding protein